MSQLSDFKISTRIGMLVAMSTLFLGLVGLIGVNGMMSINTGLKTLYEDRTVCLVQLGTIERDLFKVRVRTLKMLDQDKFDPALDAEIGKINDEIDTQWKAYTATYLTPEEKDLADRFHKALDQYRASRTKALDLLKAGDIEGAHAQVNGPVLTHFLAADEALVKDIELQERESKNEFDKASNTFDRSRTTALLVLVGAILAGFVISRVIAQGITVPVQATSAVMGELAADNLDVQVQFTEHKDEVGEMARSVAHFKDQLVKMRQMEAQARAEQDRELARGRKRELLTADFDVMVRRVIAKVHSSVESVHSASTSLHAAAEQTSRQSAAVAAAAEEATANIQTVASAAEQLGASTHEISQRVQDTTRITLEAVEDVQTADSTIEGLSTAAHKVGEIVSLINNIASQTNLLALNATIEAARAGEAGKGFAVVANEVKHLATQTAKATSEIAEQIGGIQSSTQNAVAAIKAVGTAIGRVDEVVSSIAAAVEEQNAATQEIVRNVQEAADGNHEVTRNITEVSTAAHTTGEMASGMYNVAVGLEESGASLGKHVETFLASVKAA